MKSLWPTKEPYLYPVALPWPNKPIRGEWTLLRAKQEAEHIDWLEHHGWYRGEHYIRFGDVPRAATEYHFRDSAPAVMFKLRFAGTD